MEHSPSTRVKRESDEKLVYPCSQCDFTGTKLSIIKNHIEFKHEGVKHRCHLCDYEGSKKTLWRHKKVKHGGRAAVYFIYFILYCFLTPNLKLNFTSFLSSSPP